MRERYYKLFKIIIFFLPLFIGTYGLYRVEHVSLNNALFYSFTMYFINYSDETKNLYTEIARWTAPIMTASTFILLINRIHFWFNNQMKLFRGNSIAVYGKTDEAVIFLNQLGKRGIEGDKSFVSAESFILAGEESENFLFYKNNYHNLQNKKVYLKCSSIKDQNICNSKVKLFCLEEIAARFYWKHYCLYQCASEKKFHIKVVLIGFGKLGEELLNWGILDNIFHPEQQIEYHIFGEESGYLALHHQISNISDPIIFYDGFWVDQLSVLENADRIILCEQKQQLQLIQNLLFCLREKRIDIFVDKCEGIHLFEKQDFVNLFYWKQESQRVENLFDEEILENAKRVNLRYAHIYEKVLENDKNKELEWEKLNSFTRYSNVIVADYHEIQLQILDMLEIPLNRIPKSIFELFAELEHIRWCRYHYLNNWKYGIPQNGKNKDSVKRIHCDLKPYNQLTEIEKEKDRENIRILMSIKLKL